MTALDPEMSGYLHDAMVEDLSWVLDGKRHDLRFVLQVHEDAGYPLWDGKTMVLTFRDVSLCRLDLVATVGQDSMDSCNLREPRKLAERIIPGWDSFKLVFGIALHSGSEIEVACEAVTIDIRDPS